MIGILAIVGCSEGSPLPEDLWTLNIYPGRTLTYNLGSPAYIWHNLYVENINGVLSGNVTGTGIPGRLAQWVGASIIANATNTDAQVVAAVANSHTQNTDIILHGSGVPHLFDAGYLDDDLRTDRWLHEDTNTFLGVNVIGADNLAHTGGVEGYENTAVGYMALNNITTSYYNVAVGSRALGGLTTGQYNTAVGMMALNNITTGQFNTACGMQALDKNDGSYNTALGLFAGSNNLIGDGNVFLGSKAGEDELGSNKLYIDNTDDATPLIYGDFSTDDVKINGDFQVTEDLYFPTAGGGLPYGDIYSNTSNDVVCTVQNQWYQLSFNVAGVSNLTTISVANSDITVAKTGVYMIGFYNSKYCATANDFEYAIFLNNGATQIPNMVILETTLAGTKSASSAATGLYTLTAGDTVELWVRCTDAANKTMTITHADMNITMIGR